MSKVDLEEATFELKNATNDIVCILGYHGDVTLQKLSHY